MTFEESNKKFSKILFLSLFCHLENRNNSGNPNWPKCHDLMPESEKKNFISVYKISKNF